MFEFAKKCQVIMVREYAKENIVKLKRRYFFFLFGNIVVKFRKRVTLPLQINVFPCYL